LLTRIAAIALGAALIVPGAAFAQEPGAATPGMTVRVERKGVVVSFSARAARAYRGIRGRTVTVRCTVLGPAGGLSRVDESTSANVRVPRKRSRLRVKVPARRYDLCEVSRTDGRRPPLAAALTPLGGTHLDERAAATRLVGVIVLATSLDPRSSAWPPAERVAAISEGTVVALAGPADAAPAGKVGYFSDGAHMAVVTSSSAGRRLFIDLNGDVTSTNVLEYIGSS
jgi:hypothetical protein